MQQDTPLAPSRAPDANPLPSVEQHVLIVGIASSAGGLEALGPLVGNLSSSAPMAYVVVQHLSPQHRSMLADLLSRETSLKVEEIKDGIVLRGGTVYTTPPNNDVVIERGRLHLRPPMNAVGPKPSADRCFQSLALEYGTRSIAVVLSGTGSDGSFGVREIKRVGGLVIAQTPASARYDGMPKSAIDTGVADAVLDPAEIGRKLTEFARTQDRDLVFEPPNHDNSALKDILAEVEKVTGVDFAGYKLNTINRRLARRIAATGSVNADAYLRHLRDDPGEAQRFLQDALISVTSFFRDPEVFDRVGQAFDRLLASKPPTQPLRLWVPGCATGEEAYTLAILAMERVRAKGQRHRIQMFATDLDVVALERARRGVYADTAVEHIRPDMLERYFVRQGEGYVVRKDVRDCIVFARHDVTQDTPFVRIDMISCRNLLIYFDAELQRLVLRSFHFALVPEGVLVLGKSESTSPLSSLFVAMFSDARIFRREAGPSGTAGNPLLMRQPPLHKPSRQRTLPNRTIRDAVVEHLKPAALLMDPSGDIRETEGNIDDFITIPPGRLQVNATKMLRAELRGELWALLARAKKQNSAITGTPKVFEEGGHQRRIQMTLAPFGRDPEAPQAYLLIFQDLPELEQQPPDPDSGQSAHLQQELAATREHLQGVIEELEISNEELQALNEELQASNEELNATSEETETANEELQAANEELTTVNDELRARTNELQSLNDHLENIQRSVGYALIIVDRKLRIRRFSADAVRYFGLTAADIGEPLTSVPSHVQVGDLLTRLTDTVENGTLHALDVAVERTSLSIRIRPFQTSLGEIDGAIIVILDETARRETQRRLAESEQRFALAVRGSLEGIWDQQGLDSDQGYWSPRLHEILGLDDNETRESFRALSERVHAQDRAAFDAALDRHLQARHAFDIECRLRLGPRPARGNGNGHHGAYGWFHVRGQAVWDDDGHPVRMAGSVAAIGDRKAAEIRIRSLNEQLLKAEQLAHVGHWWVNPGDDSVMWSDEIHRIHGAPPGFKPTIQRVLGYMHPEDRPKVEALFERCRDSGHPFHIEARVVRPDGELRDVEMIGECEKDGSDGPGLMFGVLRDITDTKVTERSLRGATAVLERDAASRASELQERVRERDLLMHELQHRVKNNLQMILGFVSMQSRRVPADAQRILKDIMQRISAIGFVYDIMLRRHEIEQTNFCEVIENLCTALSRAHTGKARINMEVDTRECMLPAEQAVNLAVVVNELVSNALKYAFPDAREGQITVRLGRLGREWRLVIEDDGVGLSEDAATPAGGFGLVLARSIIRNMDGRLERVQQSGTRFDVVFSAARAAAGTDD
jgi:two-component system CheB/CheR fusion protein